MKKRTATINSTPEILKALEQFKEGDRVYDKLTKKYGYFQAANLVNKKHSCWVRYEEIRADQLYVPKDGIPADPLNLELCVACFDEPIRAAEKELLAEAETQCIKFSASFQALPDCVNEGLNTPDSQTNSESPSLSSLPNIPEKSSPDTIPTSPVTTTCKPLTQNEEVLTGLLPDSPVKTSPMPENGQELQERDQDSSLKLSGSFAWYDRNLSSWRMSQGCLLEGWEPFLGSYPKSGTMRNGRLYHAPRWVESTEESESSLLPTPTATEATAGDATFADRVLCPQSSRQIIGANDTFKETKNGLGRYVQQMLPTPKATDGKHPGITSCKKGQTLHLSAAVRNLPTPTARDWKDESKNQAEREGSENLNDGVAAVTGNKKLSPTFVEKMMGFPPNWTALEDATTSCDTPTCPNGSNKPPIQIPSPTEKNDSKPSAIQSSQTQPRSLGEELPALPSKETDQWRTPNTEAQPILTLVKQLLGGEIGLDPTSNDEQRTGALAHFTQADNCLGKDWTSSGVFMNPPFSKPLPFVEKLCTEYAAGHFPQAIALLKLGCVSNKGTGALINRYASAICLWRAPRIQFTSGGVQSTTSPDFDCVLVYFGQNPALFDELFAPYGTISKVENAATVTLSLVPEETSDILVIEQLTYDEECDLNHLEKKIDNAFCKAEAIFREAVAALKEIRDRKLYRNTHATFEEYCKVRFGFKRRRPYQLIDAAVVLENLENALPEMCTNSRIGAHLLPTNERQVRYLVDLSPEEQVEVWSKATAEGKVPSGEKIKDTLDNHIRERLGKPPIPTYVEGDVVEIRSSGSETLREHDGMWGIVTEVLPSRYKVYISLKNVELRCKGNELEKVDEQHTLEIRQVSDRIKKLSKRDDLDSSIWWILEGLARQTCFTETQMDLLEWAEKRYRVE